MSFEHIDQPGWARTYLLVDPESQEAILIDPVYDFLESYLTLLNQRNLTLAYAIATHTHADHITACSSLRQSTHCHYAMWKDTSCLGVSHYLDEDEPLMLGSLELNFHHVPGHTSDHVLIETPTHLFTGDFLFTGDGGVGRDDLPSGRVRAHWDSLQKLKSLPGHLIVCSGHEPPGTALQDLSWNREHNPVLLMDSYEDFASWQEKVTAGLGSVSKIKVALPANLFAEIPDVIPWME